MAKKRYTTEYVSKEIRRVVNKYVDASYFVFYGERNDGKSYGGKEYALDTTVVQDNKKFIYMRRKHSQIVKSKMRKQFDDMNNVIFNLYGRKRYISYDSQRGFYYDDEEENVIGYALSIEDCMDIKSIPQVEIGCIIVDEFIDFNYFDEEIRLFLNIISTICRDYPDIKIFMFGNTINEFCPYFKLFGFNPKELRQGEPYYIEHSLGVKAVVMHTPTKVDDLSLKKKKNRYIGFDNNESVKMILFGEWDYDHCNTHGIDGITWNCYRHLVPIYVTAMEKVYELTLYTDSKLPILFVRIVNIQQGKCRKEILYNLSLDNTLLLTKQKEIKTKDKTEYKREYIPLINKVNNLVDKNTLEMYNLVKLCIESGRMVYDTISTGSNFLQIIDKLS